MCIEILSKCYKKKNNDSITNFSAISFFPGHFHSKSNHTDFQTSILFPPICGINFAVNLILPNTKYMYILSVGFVNRDQILINNCTTYMEQLLFFHVDNTLPRVVNKVKYSVTPQCHSSLFNVYVH